MPVMTCPTLETRRTCLPETTSLEETDIVFSWTSYRPEDHLGSTRMVINDNEEVTEAIGYQPYGTMETVGGLSSVMGTREQFTTKEFDTEGGSGSGVDGIRLNYFGARYFDPEVGTWTSTDPKDQGFYTYGYCAGNPVMLVDPNGELWEWIGMGIGILIGGYENGVMSSGSFNPGDWGNQDWFSAGMGAIQGGMMGYGIGKHIEYQNSLTGRGLGVGKIIKKGGGVASVKTWSPQDAMTAGDFVGKPRLSAKLGLDASSNGTNQFIIKSIDVGNRAVSVDFSNKATLDLSLTKPWKVSRMAKITYLLETGKNLKISNLSLTTEIYGHAAAYWLGNKVTVPKVSPFLIEHAGVANCGEWGVDGNRWVWDFID